MTDHEKRHIQNAFSFELGKVQLVPIRQRMVDMLLEVDEDLAKKVADHLGLVPKNYHSPLQAVFLQTEIRMITIL